MSNTKKKSKLTGTEALSDSDSDSFEIPPAAFMDAAARGSCIETRRRQNTTNYADDTVDGMHFLDQLLVVPREPGGVPGSEGHESYTNIDKIGDMNDAQNVEVSILFVYLPAYPYEF